MSNRVIFDREYDPLTDEEAIRNLKLRDDDIRELSTSFGRNDVNQALLDTLSGHVRIGLIDGEIFTIYGVVPVGDVVGVIWGVGTDAISKGGLDLLAWGIRSINQLFTIRPVLMNYVDARNTAHIRWLWAMKFTFTGKDIEINGVPFLHFIRTKGDTYV